MTERKAGKSNKASCAVCGVQAGQHSLREGGICDGIRNGYLDATTKERKTITAVNPEDTTDETV
jgi:hypothetical protein